MTVVEGKEDFDLIWKASYYRIC